MLILLIIVACQAFGTDTPRGTTQSELPAGTGIYDHATPIDPATLKTRDRSFSEPFERTEWTAMDSLDLDTLLPAGAQIGVQFQSFNQSFITFGSQGVLIPASSQAIAKAPRWMRSELSNVLRQLAEADQIRWAAIINSANDPYIDEIAFSVANSSTAYLSSPLANPQLFVENAQHIYSTDADLSYVQIMDYGTHSSDPDYYSTTRYQKTDVDGNIQMVEVPRDIYYWYIVHPKLTDEIPAYIDPAIVENNSTHTNNIADPPIGQFWRSFLYEVQEDTYPQMRAALMQATTLFNRDGTGGDAIRTLQTWINQTMSFTSNAERPHQPVRIYRKHFGRCGEYADYTSAAARTALIPCTSILSISTDHTWNEFWEDGWVQWEPVNGYINAPLVYENGWGKVFGTVFEIRSDGYLSPVTERYSEGIATILLSVVDSNNTPLDGARVILAIFTDSYRTDMVGFTDNDGTVLFTVGEANSYFARVETSIGIYPPIAGTYTALAANALDGGEYAYQITLDAVMPAYDVTVINPPADPSDDWRFAVSYQVSGYSISGRSTWDDIASTGAIPKFYYAVDAPGEVNLLVTDADNIFFYQDMNFCEAFAYQEASQQGNLIFDLPLGTDFFGFVDNSHRLANAQKLSGAILYQRYGVANEDQVAPPTLAQLRQNHPNPFNPLTRIAFSLPKRMPAQIKLYNARGQIVRELHSGMLDSGEHELTWDGKDASGSDTATGIYLYQLQTSEGSILRKMLRVK